MKSTNSGSRLSVVCRFAAYVSAHDSRTEVPAQKLLRDPFHYRDDDVKRLIAAARQIDPSSQIKGPTLATLFGLLTATGLRVNEALALNCGDIDWKRALVTIRLAKGNKSRVVPLHASTINALRAYASIRDRTYPNRTDASFFAWDGGGRLHYDSVNRWFLLVACQVGLPKPGDRQGPRVHDLRHYFAIRTLLNWYRSKVDVEAHLPELSTHMWHVHVRTRIGICQPLSRDGIHYILARHVKSARAKCPSLKNKRVLPHVLRHSTAMNLLQHGVDRSVIAMWLGHESMDTTQIYLHANIELKEKALAKTEPFRVRPSRYRPPDQLLAFLQAL